MNLDGIKVVTEIIGVWVTVIGLASAGVFALYEYSEYKKTERLKNTLEMLKTFNSDRISAAKLRVLNSELKSSDSIRKLLLTKENVDSKYRSAILERINGDNLGNDISEIINFLENVAMCSKSGICEKESADAFFKNYGRNFFRTYYPYICSERVKWNSNAFALVLERFYNGGDTKGLCI